MRFTFLSLTLSLINYREIPGFYNDMLFYTNTYWYKVIFLKFGLNIIVMENCLHCIITKHIMNIMKYCMQCIITKHIEIFCLGCKDKIVSFTLLALTVHKTLPHVHCPQNTGCTWDQIMK